MRHLLYATLLLCQLSVVLTPAVAQDDYYRGLSSSMEDFGTVLQEIATKYVEDVGPEEVVRAGIRGMLADLDPYSVYLVDDERESVDRLATGYYVGLGFSVARVDSALVLSDVVPDFPAFRAGLRRGDRLIAVDGALVASRPVDSVRRFTRGPEGSACRLTVVRHGRPDTLELTAVRERIPLRPISVVERLADGVGYIRIDQFSRRVATQLTRAIDSLQTIEPLTGLILDLRDNPGGLLEGAIQMSEIFLPYGTLVVSTRGANAGNTDHTTTAPAVFPDLPLVILVNASTASSSEIVAGALQDLDRAVVVGSRTFGKGLVQTVRPLRNGATLKLTTSRYYTPSGRCIQEEGLRSDVGRDQTYSTRNGRPVRAGHGITPDIMVKPNGDSHGVPATLQALMRNWVVADYVSTCTPTPPSAEGFVACVSAIPAVRLPGCATLAAVATETPTDSTVSSLVQQAIEAQRAYVVRELVTHRTAVEAVLQAEAVSRMRGRDELTRLLLPYDPDVRVGQDVLTTRRYRALLRGESASDQ
ncbi:MAG: S41 family peptidase [Candidatus Kapaibacteriota bacterium]